MSKYRFGPATPDENIVFGACRPGYPSDSPTSKMIDEWIEFMRERHIERVCCLLDEKIEHYDKLLNRYEQEFGAESICHAPITDHETISKPTLLETVLPFLREARTNSERAVVHCSAGIGRTGHVLALWLTHERGYNVKNAIEEVERKTCGKRNPCEATDIEQLEWLSH